MTDKAEAIPDLDFSAWDDVHWQILHSVLDGNLTDRYLAGILRFAGEPVVEDSRYNSAQLALIRQGLIERPRRFATLRRAKATLTPLGRRIAEAAVRCAGCSRPFYGCKEDHEEPEGGYAVRRCRRCAAGKELDAMIEDAIQDHEMTYHPFVQCSEVDGRCAVVVAREQAVEIERLRADLAQFKETAEWFGDPTVTDRIAGILTEAKPRSGCSDMLCSAINRCPRCMAEALVDAMRAEHLVVLTVEAADEIIQHAKIEVS